MPILSWLDKSEAITMAKNCKYRLLEEIPEFSYGDSNTENMLIHGDNLEALKSLIPYFAGKIKCIYIDPPYNTKSAFEQYDDNLEHSRWLSMMYPRLELLRELLSEDGSIWVSIDDNESHYMKVIMDEIYGRNNFVANNIWQKLYTVKNSAKYLSDMHEHVICYAKCISKWERNLLPRSEKATSGYTNLDNDPRGDWTTNAIQARNYYSLGSYEIKGPTGKIFSPPAGTFWRISEESFKQLDSDNRIWWGQKGESTPRVKKFLSEAKEGVVPATFWPFQEVGSNAEAKAENRALFEGIAEIFATPKPERLIERILTIATNEGDLVLDSFLGSGTTAAAAHKMRRRYIGIEIGNQALSHCQPRLKKVIDGNDKNGISESTNWTGGGGFRFYNLGECIFDEYGMLNINTKFRTLAAHIWFLETKTSLLNKVLTPFIGEFDGTAFYLLYNGILGDRRPQNGNVLTSKILNELPKINDFSRVVIYGESSRLGEARLKNSNITFKQIPYDVSTL